MIQTSSYARGIGLIILANFIFSIQDGITKHLAEQYHVFSIAMIRYWGFAAFVVVFGSIIASRKGGQEHLGILSSIGQVAQSNMLKMQIARGILLGLQVCLIAYLFAEVGLISTHVIFATYPLLVTLFSIPLLGEKVGIWRFSAVFCGFLGLLIILQPDSYIFEVTALLPLVSAAAFALYNIMTRYVARVDSAETSFFWTGIGGFIVLTLIGPFFWDPPRGSDIYWMITLCITGALGHYLMIRALAATEASVLQPFAFLPLVFVSLIGVFIFNEPLTQNTIIGATVIVASGLFIIWRERQRAAASKT